MRLIDADDLKNYIDCGHLRPPTEVCFSELDVVRMLDGMATIDAEPVVRCKECKHYKPEEDYSNVKMCYGFAIGYWPHPDDFCSRGAKMDEEVRDAEDNKE